MAFLADWMKVERCDCCICTPGKISEQSHCSDKCHSTSFHTPGEPSTSFIFVSRAQSSPYRSQSDDISLERLTPTEYTESQEATRPTRPSARHHLLLLSTKTISLSIPSQSKWRAASNRELITPSSLRIFLSSLLLADFATHPSKNAGIVW